MERNEELTVEVTDSMIRAGVAALDEWSRSAADDVLVVEIYTAMQRARADDTA